MKEVLEMLTYRRPAGSDGEKAFLERFIMPFKPKEILQNLIVVVPGDPLTLFSCHTDTVHRNDDRQKVIYDAELECAYKDDKEPLGADNTAGCWMLMEMIRAGIPGTYAFHYGEERGCLGSRALATNAKQWLSGYSRAIAFDRRGTTSIITHQMSNRTCSDEFGQALADMLGSGYVLDKTGLYTDTASYVHLIAECTNVSVGYDFEHGPEETLDLYHLQWLRDQMFTMRFDTLPTVREPDKESIRDRKWVSNYHYGTSSNIYDAEYDWEGGAANAATAVAPAEAKTKSNWCVADPLYMNEDDVNRLINLSIAEFRDYQDVEDMMLHEPQLAAQILFAYFLRQEEWEEAAAETEEARVPLNFDDDDAANDDAAQHMLTLVSSD